MGNTSSDLSYSLFAARVNRNLTRKDVTQKTGISYAMLGRYERGEIEPRASDLQKLCLLYDIGIENLRFDAPQKTTTGKSRGRKKK